MKTSEAGKELIKRFEGLRLRAYHCSANVLTIGYGHTGQDVHENMVITERQANHFLEKDLKKFEKAINTQVTVDLEQHQFDALVSWVYNLGLGNFENSTMLKELNKNNKQQVPAEMKRWVYAGGKKLPGLVKRRVAESQLFSTAAYEFSY